VRSRRRFRVGRIALILSAFFAVLISVNEFSNQLSIAPCNYFTNTNSQQHGEDDAANNKCSAKDGIIFQGVSLLSQIPAEWLGALASIFIAIFTLTLWIATDRLWRISMIHARHLGRSVSATRISAEAQRIMATGMTRPRIRVRQFDLDPLYEGRTPFKAGEPIYGRFSIVNIGGALARIVVWRCHLLIGQEGGPPNWPLTVNPDPESDQFEADRPILDTGVHTELRFKSRFCATDIDEMNLSSSLSEFGFM
jgi:hypothetical protein